jgi:hypothetical protein
MRGTYDLNSLLPHNWKSADKAQAPPDNTAAIASVSWVGGIITAISRSQREGWGHQAVEVDTRQILADQCQTGLVAQIVRQWFDDEIGHGIFTFWVEQHMGSKSLI